MSASTERKMRQAARAAGTDKKMLAAQQAAEQKKKSNRRWTLGTIAVILLIALIFFLDSGFLYTKTTAVTIGDEKYTPAEVSYRYARSYINTANQYGNYASVFGLSGGLGSLATTDCPFGEGTWRDYLLDETITEMEQTKALTDYAAANGISLDADETAEIDSALTELESYAKTNGFRNASAFLAANYGTGVNTAIARETDLASALAAKVYTAYSESLSYTAEQLEEEYQSYNGDHDLFTYVIYTVNAAVEEGAEAPTEEALAEAHADAEAVSMAYTDGDDIDDVQERFEAAVDSQFEGETPTVRSGMYGSNLSADYKEWMLDAGRKAGDVLVADSTSGSSVIVFLSRDDNHYATANVRHILVKAEADEDGNYSDEALEAARTKAEEILAEWEAGEKTEESFAALAEEYSEDPGSSANGGLYENVARGQMVDEFDAFIFGERKSGDTAIVYGNNGSYAGYHVMYYVGEGGQYSDLIAESSLRSSDVSAWLEELTAGYEAVRGNALRRVG